MVFVSCGDDFFAAEKLLHVLPQPPTPAASGFMVIVKPFTLQRADTWTPVKDPVMAPIESVVGPAIWSDVENGRRVIKLPCMNF